MLTKMLVQHRVSRRLIRLAGAQRTEDIAGEVLPFVPQGVRLLDIGAGTCDVAARLASAGRLVVAIDVQNTSVVPGFEPVIFDGIRLPFDDQSFEWALLIDVLHHTDPERLLREAARVATWLIVHEDVFVTRQQMHLTFLMDSITNLEFVGHPHANKTDRGWRRLFQSLGLTLHHASQRDFWRMFTCATYVLEVPR